MRRRPLKGGMLSAFICPWCSFYDEKVCKLCNLRLSTQKLPYFGTALSLMVTESLKNIVGLDDSSINDPTMVLQAVNSACFGVREALSLNAVQFVMHKASQILQVQPWQ